MKILVLGGSGIVGRAVVRDLTVQADVSKIVIGDLNVAPSPGSPPLKGPGMTIRTVLDEFAMNPMV